jgi:uncharacterized membrane protein YtjA (UPF0391 family)
MILFWAILFFIGAIVSGILGFGGFLDGRVETLVAEWMFGILLAVCIFFLVAYFRGRPSP